MVEMTVSYLGDLRCEAVHGPSGATILTDAPTDNHGKGEMFSPTDLVATALSTCMLTLMGIACRRHGMSIDGASAQVKKEMVTAPQRRVGKITVLLRVPTTLTDEQKQILIDAALSCPVHHSLHPDITIDTQFEWGA